MKAIGFDQKITLPYLDITANTLRIHLQKKEVYDVLDGHLLTLIKGDKSRKNAITILMKIWSSVDENIPDLQKKIIREYPFFTDKEKLLIHYCLTSIAYPFFMTQMSFVGKQLKMSDVIFSKSIIAEMKKNYGDRRRVEVAPGAVFSSVKDWDILRMIRAGSYEKNISNVDTSKTVIKSLMIEVIMHNLNTNAVPFEYINNNAVFFPFDYSISIGDIDQKRFLVTKTIRDIIIERNPKVLIPIE